MEALVARPGRVGLVLQVQVEGEELSKHTAGTLPASHSRCRAVHSHILTPPAPLHSSSSGGSESDSDSECSSSSSGGSESDGSSGDELMEEDLKLLRCVLPEIPTPP